MDTIKEPYMNQEGHLNFEGITFYVNNLLLDSSEEIPPVLFNHVKECLICKSEVLELHETVEGKTTTPAPLTVSTDSASIETLLAKITQDVAFQNMMIEGIQQKTTANTYLSEKMGEQLVMRDAQTLEVVSPTKDQLCVGQIAFSFKEILSKPISINIINNNGQEQEYTCPAKSDSFVVDMSQSPTGFYYYILYDNGNVVINPFYFCSKEDAIQAYQEYINK